MCLLVEAGVEEAQAIRTRGMYTAVWRVVVAVASAFRR